MARKVWTFTLEDGPHVVELDHGYWTGRKTLRLDGEIIVEVKRNLLDLGGVEPFRIGEHDCAVWIETHGLAYRYDLVVDRRSVETGENVDLRHGQEPAKDLQRRINDRVQADGFLLLIFAAYHGLFGPLHPAVGMLLAALGLSLLVSPRRSWHFHVAMALAAVTGLLLIAPRKSGQDTHFGLIQFVMAGLGWFQWWHDRQTAETGR